jgi:hypothetical protein
VYAEDKTIYSSLCSAQGTRVYIKIENPIPLNTLSIILISGVTNPEQSLCQLQRPLLTVVTLDNSTVIAKSSIARSNIDTYKLALNPKVNYLYWKLEGATSSPFHLIIGPDVAYKLSSVDETGITRFNYGSIEVVPGQYS